MGVCPEGVTGMPISWPVPWLAHENGQYCPLTAIPATRFTAEAAVAHRKGHRPLPAGHRSDIWEGKLNRGASAVAPAITNVAIADESFSPQSHSHSVSP